MGIDCTWTIPAPARIRDVADVIGMLLGCPKELRPLGDMEGSFYNHVEGIEFRRFDHSATGLVVPECTQIVIHAKRGGGFLYHHEWGAFGHHGIMEHSCPENIALFVSLCSFFGGEVDFDDCDDQKVDYREPVREDIHAEDGQPWDHFQMRMHAVEPLTEEDIAPYRKTESGMRVVSMNVELRATWPRTTTR